MAGESTGIVGDVRGLAATGLRALRTTRLELAAIEISEEKAWAVQFLTVAVAGLYLVTFGLLLAVLALVLWPPRRTVPAILDRIRGRVPRGGHRRHLVCGGCVEETQLALRRHHRRAEGRRAGAFAGIEGCR